MAGINREYLDNVPQSNSDDADSIEADLKEKWVSFETPISFAGISKIYDYYKGRISKKRIQGILTSIPVYTKYKEVKRPKLFNPYYIYFKHQQWHADLIYVIRLKEWNDGVQYLLAVIELFSRKLFITPMQNKTTDTTIESFHNIHRHITQSPRTIYADKGGEFNSNKFKSYCNKYGIKPIYSESVFKASIVERAIKTYQSIMYKYMAQYNTSRYIDYLPEITRTFNTRVNRTIGMCPNDAYQPRNKSVVLYNLELHYNKTFKRRRLPTFTVNDRVRILRLSRNRELSKKIYNTKFTEEIFTIIRINTRLPIPRYYIKDSNGDNIDGAFQEYELSKVL